MKTDDTLPLGLNEAWLVLSAGWEAYIREFARGMIGDDFTTLRRADLVLQALAIGAGRWAARPDAPVTVGNSRRITAVMNAASAQGRDAAECALRGELASGFQRTCRTLGEEYGLSVIAQALRIPLQLAAIRVAAPRVFEPLDGHGAIRATLDLYLAEELPAGVRWLGP